jgi:predicted RNA-binding Zn-ribbon protein involved in translation (DUF1610 family)
MIILSFLVFLISLWDVIDEKQWLAGVSISYAILLILTIVLLATRKKTAVSKDTVEEFEKTLEGKLCHFKCPNCQGIFAIKKSSRNNKKPFTLTCPDCGTIGKISSSPPVIVEEIPEQKSENIKFKCKSCGERVSIWAEGTDLVQDIQIYSCPYCGEKQSMKNI